MTAYQISDNCAWIVITGGFRKCRSSIAISGCDITIIVELGMIYKGLKTQNHSGLTHNQLIAEKYIKHLV